MSEQENAAPELQVNLAETPPAPALELADRQREQKQAAEKESMTLDTRKDRTQEGLQLPEPFNQKQMQEQLKLTSGGSNSQVRRWIYWGWVENAGFGQYRRTANFGGVKASPYKGKLKTQKHSYPVSVGSPGQQRRYTSKGLKINAQLACDFPGCDYIGYGSTPTNALRSVGRHKSLQHGVKKRYISVKERKALGYSARTKFVIPGNGLLPPKQEEPVPAPEPVVELSYCPHCGTNLQMHATAYRIARKHSRKD